MKTRAKFLAPILLPLITRVMFATPDIWFHQPHAVKVLQQKCVPIHKKKLKAWDIKLCNLTLLSRQILAQ